MKAHLRFSGDRKLLIGSLEKETVPLFPPVRAAKGVL